MGKVAGIYQIKNLINGKIYIGSSVNIQVRWWTHKSRLRRGIHGNPHLQSAWNKYGEDAFEFSILEIVEKREDAVILEQDYLDMFLPEYNVVQRAEATNLGRKFSEENIQNMRDAKLGMYDGEKNPFYGKKHSRETKELLSKQHIGMKQSPETIRKKIQAQIGEKSHYAKLTWDTVNEIRAKFESGKYTEAKLVKMYNMSQGAINKLLRYKTWRIEE
jgi:group I intron endonuclease